MMPQKSPEQQILPDPELLRYYNQYVGPGTAEKIVDKALELIASREQLEQTKQKMNYDLQVREQRIQICGQICAFVIALTAIGGGLWLAGSSAGTATVVTGGVITSGTVAAIVTAFLKGRKPPEKF